jgi:hypothetical protein
MTLTEAASEFQSLSAPAKSRFFLRLAHELTIRARGAYGNAGSGVGVANPAALRAFNELQHKVAGHLLHLTETGTQAYPDDVLVRILSDIAGEAGIANDLRIASEQALRGL